MSLDFYEPSNEIGKNRLCLHGEQIPHTGTDKYFQKYGIDNNLMLIVLSIMYVNSNPKLKNSTDYSTKAFFDIATKCKNNFQENKIDITKKQLKMLINFVDRDLYTLKHNFPYFKDVEKQIHNVYYYLKCYYNSHNNSIPHLGELFKDIIY